MTGISVLLVVDCVGARAMAEGDLFFSDLPIVASVSRLPQRLADAPSSVTVLDRAMIKASGARSLNDLFRLVPGFQTFAPSDKPSRVNYHGISDDGDFSPRVQVLVDGRSLHSPLFRGGMNWELAPVALEDIERIEVVRGSNTTSYGTNAFLGVINIITIDPALVRGVSVATNQGNQGVRDFGVHTGGALGEIGNFRVTYQHRADDGLDHNADPREFADWRDRNRARLLDVRAHFQLDTRDLLELQFGRVESRRFTGRLDDREPGGLRTGDPLRNLDQTSDWLQLRWLHTLSDSSDFSLRYTHNTDGLDNAFTHPLLGRVNPAGGRGTRHEVEALHTFLPSRSTRLIWGASWRHDTLHSRIMLHGIGKADRDVGRVFVNSEWKPKNWFTGNLGLSYEYDSLAGRHVAPRASASFHLTPDNTLRIGYARAWRTPGVLDYRANLGTGVAALEWRGNPDLPAERLDSWELAYLGDWRALRMSLDVRYFHEQVTDRLMNRINSGAGQPNMLQPVQNMRIKGIEYQWKWQPLDATQIVLAQSHIRIDSSLTSIGKRLVANPDSNFFRARDRYLDLAERAAPRQSTSVLLMQRLPGDLELSIARYWVGDIKWTRNTDTDKYNRTDVRLGYPFRLGSQAGEIAYTVQSLDGAHSEERMQRIVDRRHWVSLRMDF